MNIKLVGNNESRRDSESPKFNAYKLILIYANVFVTFFLSYVAKLNLIFVLSV